MAIPTFPLACVVIPLRKRVAKLFQIDDTSLFGDILKAITEIVGDDPANFG